MVIFVFFFYSGEMNNLKLKWRIIRFVKIMFYDTGKWLL